MQQAHHYIHAGGPQYAPPVLRAPSPTSSIGTEYGADETSLSDKELSPEDFDTKQDEALQLHQPREDELEANRDPRLFRPKSALEEKALHEFVMAKLRAMVRQLEEDELFEQMMHSGTQLGEETQPSSSDVDNIMRSLMGPTANAQSTVRSAVGPDKANAPRSSHATNVDSESSATTAGKNSRKPRIEHP